MEAPNPNKQKQIKINTATYEFEYKVQLINTTVFHIFKGEQNGNTFHHLNPGKEEYKQTILEMEKGCEHSAEEM